MLSAPLFAALAIHTLCEFVPGYPHADETASRRLARIAARLAGLLAMCAMLGLAPAIWPLALALTLAHAAIDDAASANEGLGGLLRDQGLHVVAIALFSVAAGVELPADTLQGALRSPEIWIAAVGFVFAVFVGGVVVGRIVQPFASALAGKAGGLAHAGRLIGLLERSLIFGAIGLELGELIGFVVAAKAILRFPEAREGSRELSEYYLVGTLASVSWAVAVAVLTRFAMSQLP